MAEVSFGEWLMRRRKQGGLDQEQLAHQPEFITAMEQDSAMAFIQRSHLH